jgi:DNA polymerase-4
MALIKLLVFIEKTASIKILLFLIAALGGESFNLTLLGGRMKKYSQKKQWHRIIAHVDMDAFFASVEQYDFLKYSGKPIGVVNGRAGTTIITASYEARKFGIKTGMHIARAKALCPGFIPVSSRPNRYAEVSTNFLTALQDLTPEIEVFSVDEAFLEFTRCGYIYHSPDNIADKIKKVVFQASGLTCSVGISGDKSTAKFASKLNKPSGITIIPPWDAEKILAPYPVTDLCGVGYNIGEFLKKYHVLTCGNMKNIPISVLSNRFGNLGRKLWLMAQAKDPSVLVLNTAPVKSLSASKVLPPNTTDKELVEQYFYYCCDKVASRLRQSKLFAKRVTVDISMKHRRMKHSEDFILAVNDESKFFDVAKQLMALWDGKGIYKIGLYLEKLCDQEHFQKDFFETQGTTHDHFNAIRDAVNERFGVGSMQTARAMQVPSLTDVIAPAWKPDGIRNSVKTDTARKGTGRKKPV